jgi:hypothetical protein
MVHPPGPVRAPGRLLVLRSEQRPRLIMAGIVRLYWMKVAFIAHSEAPTGVVGASSSVACGVRAEGQYAGSSGWSWLTQATMPPPTWTASA